MFDRLRHHVLLAHYFIGRVDLLYATEVSRARDHAVGSLHHVAIGARRYHELALGQNKRAWDATCFALAICDDGAGVVADDRLPGDSRLHD